MAKRAVVVERERRERERNNRLRKEAKDVAARAGLATHIDAMPSYVKDFLYTSRVSKPSLVFTAAVTDEKVKRHVGRRFERFFTLPMKLKLPNLEEEVTLTPGEVLSILSGIHRGIFRVPVTNIGRSLAGRMRELSKVTRAVGNSSGMAVWQELFAEVRTSLMFHNRMEGKFFMFQAKDKPCFLSGYGGTFVIDALIPEERRFTVDGEVRLTYRVPMTYFGINEKVTIDAGLFGGTVGEQLPVYIQRHAIRRLHERLPDLKDGVDSFIPSSIVFDPEVVRQEMDGTFLIAFRYAMAKIGYFSARVIDGCVVLTSFIFITMSQTPEGQRLWDLLRLTQGEMQWNGLHDMGTFLNTDILDDSVFGRALDLSGCNGIREIAGYIQNKEPGKESAAASLRQYMQMDARKEARLLERLDAQTPNPEGTAA